MKTVIQSLQNFYRKGTSAALLVQGNFLYFRELTVSQSGVIGQDTSGRNWFLDPDSISGYSLDFNPSLDELPLIESSRENKSDCCSRGGETVLPNEDDEARRTLEHGEYEISCSEPKTGTLGEYAAYMRDAEPCSEALSKGEHDFLIKGYPSDDYKILEHCVELVNIPVYSRLDRVSRRKALIRILMENQESYLSNQTQKVLLLLARDTETAEEVEQLAEITSDKCVKGDADPAFTAAVLYLIRKKNPYFEPEPRETENILPLLVYLRREWGIKAAEGDAAAIQETDGGEELLASGEADLTKRLMNETYYQVSLKYRLKNSSKKQVPYQFWLHFLPQPDSKDELYLNAHQIIDPFLSRCLTTMPEDRITSSSFQVTFFAGCNDKGVTANFAFMTSSCRKAALKEAAQFPAFHENGEICLDSFKLLPVVDGSLLEKRFGTDNCRNRQIQDSAETLKDALLLLFLRQVLDGADGRIDVPGFMEERKELLECASQMARQTSLPLKMYWLNCLIYRLRESGMEERALLIECFCYGLAQDHPFFISQNSWEDKNKDFLWDRCLKALQTMRLTEALRLFPYWRNALLRKRKRVSFDQLDPVHRQQWDRILVLEDFLRSVLEGDLEKSRKNIELLAGAEGAWKSEKAAIERIGEAAGLDIMVKTC